MAAIWLIEAIPENDRSQVLAEFGATLGQAIETDEAALAVWRYYLETFLPERGRTTSSDALAARLKNEMGFG